MNGHFICSACGLHHLQVPPVPWCAHCQSPLSYAAAQQSRFPRVALRGRAPGMWRYREALPPLDPVCLGEMMTPLVPVRIGQREVLLKCDHQLPTGSYKDRGSAVLVSYLREQRVAEAVEDSSGNAGASLAAYCARAGVSLRVFCPESAAAGKLTQVKLAGAALQRVPGRRARATEALLEHLADHEAVYASHLWHPLFLEGVKTMAFEIVEQLGWTAPHAVVCPVGAGSILLGLHRGFGELHQAGVISRPPRLIAVQASSVDPVYRAHRSGAQRVAPMPEPAPTLAEGIALPAPVRDREVLQALRSSGGTVVTVDEREIVAGVQALGRAGFCVEPTSGVIWHGMRHLDEQGLLPSAATVVCVLSGHGLKAAAAISALLA